MTPSNFKDLSDIFIDLIRTALPVITGLALMVFFWGLAKFIFRVGGDENAVEGGKRLMIWGLIALFVMISVWGIIRFMQNALLLAPGGSSPSLPGSDAVWNWEE